MGTASEIIVRLRLDGSQFAGDAQNAVRRARATLESGFKGSKQSRSFTDAIREARGAGNDSDAGTKDFASYIRRLQREGAGAGESVAGGMGTAASVIKRARDESSSLEKVLTRIGKSPGGVDAYLEALAKVAPTAIAALGVTKLFTTGLGFLNSKLLESSARGKGLDKLADDAAEMREQMLVSIPIVGALGQELRHLGEISNKVAIAKAKADTITNDQKTDFMGRQVASLRNVQQQSREIAKAANSLGREDKSPAESMFGDLNEQRRKLLQLVEDAKKAGKNPENIRELQKAYDALGAAMGRAAELSRRELETNSRSILQKTQDVRSLIAVARARAEGNDALADSIELAQKYAPQLREIDEQISTLDQRHEDNGTPVTQQKAFLEDQKIAIKEAANAEFQALQVQRERTKATKQQEQADKQARTAADALKDAIERNSRIDDTNAEAKSLELRNKGQERAAELEEIKARGAKRFRDAQGDPKAEAAAIRLTRAELEAFNKETRNIASFTDFEGFHKGIQLAILNARRDEGTGQAAQGIREALGKGNVGVLGIDPTAPTANKSETDREFKEAVGILKEAAKQQLQAAKSQPKIGVIRE